MGLALEGLTSNLLITPIYNFTLLTDFRSMFHFYTLLKRQEAAVLFMVSWRIETENRYEMVNFHCTKN